MGLTAANPAYLVGATPEKLRSLTRERVSREGGCEVTWVRVDRELYKGSAGTGRSCRTAVRGATHVVSYSELGHIFRKRAEPSR